MGVGGQHHVPTAFPLGKTRYPLYRSLGGPQGRSGQVRKISPPPRFNLRTVQPVVSRYTDYAVQVPYHKAFFFFCWRYNPLWVLAFSVIFFHSVLSLLSFLHPFIPIIWISSSTSSIHLSLGLTLILLPIGFNSNILLGILPPSIRITCPSQAILLLFINVTMSALPAKNTLSLCNFFRCFPNTVTFSYMCS